MDNFNRDIEAVDVLNEFYNVDLCVLLENECDMYFWSGIFELHLPDKEVQFESVTSCSYLNKNGRGCSSFKEFEDDVSKLDSTGITFLIAKDSDYNCLQPVRMYSPRVITTYGYTQENTLLCPWRIAKVICKDIPLNKTHLNRIISEVISWFNETSILLMEFLTWNISAELLKKEGTEIEVPSVMGRKSDRFHNNGRLFIEEINSIINSVSAIIPHVYYTQAEQLVRNCNMDNRYIISGHFWESLVIDMIKRKVIENKKIIKRLRPEDKEFSTSYNTSCETILKRCALECHQTCSNRIACKDVAHLKEHFSQLNI